MSRRHLFVLFGLVAAVTCAAPRMRLAAQMSAGPVVISQIYGGGGNASTILRNDFIELFNRGTSPVDLTGWSVQYASSAGSTWQRTDLTSVILQPGQYYLVQEAAQGGGTQDLPTPDVSGTIPMSASSGKVALVNHQTLLTGACPSTGIVDFVGFGPGATCSETAPTTPNLTNTTAALRKNAGCSDTNNNLDDFSNGTPAPRNSASTIAPCNGPAPLSVAGAAVPAAVTTGDPVTIRATVSPGSNPASTGITVTGDLSAIGGPANAILLDDGASGDGAAGDNIFGIETIVLASTPVGSRSIGVTVADLESRSASSTFSLQVNAPLVVRLPHDIQGPGGVSPFAGQMVSVEGVVTARKFNGYFIQSRDDEQDADPMSSEGLFVFTNTAPPASVIVGNRVRVTGTVVEFVPAADPNTLPLTEIAAGSTVVDLGADQLPSPTPLTTVEVHPNAGRDVLERFEGMRVSFASLTAVAPTQGTVNETMATGSNNGVFYATITGTPRPTREPGIALTDSVPPCGGCTPPRFDENPERLRIDSDAILGTLPIAVASGAVLTNVVGLVDYGFRTYTLLPETTLVPSGGFVATPVRPVGPDEFTVASFNVQRFFDTVNDPSLGDEPVLTATAFANRLSKASQLVRNYLRLPDVVGVQEVENLSTLQAIAAAINSDAGLGNDYVAYLVEGNDIGGIDVGFLVRSSRVAVTSVEQVGKTTTYIQPDGVAALLNDRPPLVLRGTVDVTGQSAVPITVVVNHLRSLNGIEDETSIDDGPRVREKRRQQAEFLANLLQTLQNEPGAGLGRVISVGDYNAFAVNDGYVDLIGTILGTPTPAAQVVLASPDLVDPDFLNPAAADYSYVFDGNAQSLDHLLVSRAAGAVLVDVQHARVNADFAEVLRGAIDPVTGVVRPERLSDHDPIVAFFTFPPDTVAPVLAGVPADITAVATSPAGAGVTYATPTATDDIDGAIDVTCAPPSGTTFAIGVTTVACDATDTAGNRSTASFTVTVTDPKTQGILAGVGQVPMGGARLSFTFAALEVGNTQTAVAAITAPRSRGVDVFTVLQPSAVFFQAGGRAVTLLGTGFWNGRGGYAFEIFAQDLGEPGRHRDLFSIVVRDPSGAEVLRAGGTLVDGTIR